MLRIVKRDLTWLNGFVVTDLAVLRRRRLLRVVERDLAWLNGFVVTDLAILRCRDLMHIVKRDLAWLSGFVIAETTLLRRRRLLRLIERRRRRVHAERLWNESGGLGLWAQRRQARLTERFGRRFRRRAGEVGDRRSVAVGSLETGRCCVAAARDWAVFEHVPVVVEEGFLLLGFYRGVGEGGVWSGGGEACWGCGVGVSRGEGVGTVFVVAVGGWWHRGDLGVFDV